MLNVIPPIDGSLLKTVDKVRANKADGEKTKAKIKKKNRARKMKK